ncbi:hypothetical protein ACO0M4_29270 [Streptomyces sp. RGM 3693]|uniref:hypothetical protein n=1 Tax=Streptomyces sp. RGM 3693 TaxID=3413284 RepID=UPI003D2C0B0C
MTGQKGVRHLPVGTGQKPARAPGPEAAHRIVELEDGQPAGARRAVFGLCRLCVTDKLAALAELGLNWATT